MLLALFFFLKTDLAIHDLLWFHMNFRIFFSIFVKSVIRILKKIALTLYIALGNMNILTVEQNKEFRNKSTHIRSTDLQQGCQEYTMGKSQCHQQILLRKLDIHMQKNKVRLLTYTTHKNKLKNGIKTTLRSETVKFLEENIGVKLGVIGIGNDFMDMTPKTQVA